MLGYTVSFVEKVKAADGKKLGVKLGRKALAKNIPISRIAFEIGVSRMAVYDWFTGRYTPSPTHAEKLQTFIDKQ